MLFVDRLSKYPNRYIMSDEDNNESYVYLRRADEPYVEGTPLNAATFNSSLLLSFEESADYPGCYFYKSGDETVWLNPPMVPQQEYRTMKRYNGSPVYTCAWFFSDLKNSSGADGYGNVCVSAILNDSILRIVKMTATFSRKEIATTLTGKHAEKMSDMVWSEDNTVSARARVDFHGNYNTLSIVSFDDNVEKFDALVTLEYTLY